MEILAIHRDRRLGPQALDGLDPLVGKVVSGVVVNIVRPHTHLGELALVGTRDHIEPCPSVRYLIQRSNHFRDRSRILQDRVDSGPDLHGFGDFCQRCHRDRRVECRIPLLGFAAISAILCHGHDEVVSQLFCQNRDFAVVGI